MRRANTELAGVPSVEAGMPGRLLRQDVTDASVTRAPSAECRGDPHAPTAAFARCREAAHSHVWMKITRPVACFSLLPLSLQHSWRYDPIQLP